MKIALVRKRYTPYGGAEKYLEDLSRRLAQAGHEVHLFSNRWPSAPDFPTLKIHTVPMVRGWGLLSLCSFLHNVDRLLLRKSFDVIQSSEKNRIQDVFHGDDGCHREWLLQRRRYEPFIRSQGIRFNPMHRYTLALEKRLFTSGLVSCFVAISPKGGQEIRTHYPAAGEKIQVITNAVGLPAAPPPMRRRSSRKAKNILFVGSGFFRKGLFFLIRALPLVQGEGPVELTVVGRDRPEKVKRLANRVGVGERVHFIGPVADPTPYYHQADVLALPSIYEPFGNVVLEAMAFGLPVVVSRYVGAADWIHEGRNGWVVSEPADRRELAEAVVRCLQLQPERVSEYNREILPLFSWENHLLQLTQVYRRVENGKKRGER